MANFNEQALKNLNFTIADLRDPSSREKIKAEVERLRSESSSGGGGTQMRQRDVALALDAFAGFRDAALYGPTVTELAANLTEAFGGISPNRIVQHLAKMRAEGVIDSAPMMESTGKRGRPRVFYFLVDEDTLHRIQRGEYTAKG